MIKNLLILSALIFSIQGFTQSEEKFIFEIEDFKNELTAGGEHLLHIKTKADITEFYVAVTGGTVFKSNDFDYKLVVSGRVNKLKLRILSTDGKNAVLAEQDFKVKPKL